MLLSHMDEISQMISIITIISFLPICLFIFYKQPVGIAYAILLSLPLFSTIIISWLRIYNGWHSDFVSSLWISIATGLLLFCMLSVFSINIRRITILFLPYMALFALSATIWGYFIRFDIDLSLSHPFNHAWLAIHIISSLITYALITLAAMAALAVYIRQWALKAKRKSKLIDALPFMADGEILQINLMIISEIILGAGLVSGIATQIMQGGIWFDFDHKILLSLLAFIILSILLFSHFKFGIRGQKAARILLLCYLIVTMSFIGVKFITDVLIGG